MPFFSGFLGWERRGLPFSIMRVKTHMENLKTEPIKIKTDEGIEEYLLMEKDHGDLVVYDIYRKDHYLLTLARDGSILFMNFEADEKDKEIFKLSQLNRFIEKIQTNS
jgi:hypothetical protein